MKWLLQHRYFHEPGRAAGPVCSCVVKGKTAKDAKLTLIEIARSLKYYVEIYNTEQAK